MSIDLNELADRVEALAGPDRETDAVIWLAVIPGATRKATVIPDNERRKGWVIDETREASGKLIIVPAYTGSIDDAMTLIPEGWTWDVDATAPEFGIDWTLWGPKPGVSVKGCADTAELALVSAALRCKALGSVHTMEGL